MKALLNAYNTTTHSSIGCAPNDMTADLKKAYIERKRAHTDALRLTTRLDPGTTVRIMTASDRFKKKRSNLSTELYTVSTTEGSNVLIKGMDHSVASYQRFKLFPSTTGKLAKTIDDAK